jgi:hypothetical protein
MITNGYKHPRLFYVYFSGDEDNQHHSGARPQRKLDNVTFQFARKINFLTALFKTRKIIYIFAHARGAAPDKASSPLASQPLDLCGGQNATSLPAQKMCTSPGLGP